MRDRLIELIKEANDVVKRNGFDFNANVSADYLLANGVIVPPCKVGDVVYVIDDIVWDSECGECEHYLIGGFGDPSECARTRYGNKHPCCIEIKEETVTQHDIYYYLYGEKIGKTVFLTKEEAEQALERMKGEKEE